MARLARKFPAVLDRLAEGAIHLSALRILAPCLTPENHVALLDRAKHKSKDEVEQIAASVRPRPDVPSVIRKLPEPASSVLFTSPGETALFGVNTDDTHAEANPGLQAQPVRRGVTAETVPEAPVVPAPSRRATVAPLSPGRYKIEFTADAETHQALRQLQELMRHQVPNGDPAKIFKKALFLLLEQVREAKTGQVKRPRTTKTEAVDLWMEEEVTETAGPEAQPVDPSAARESRYIPAEVKRSVWNRDEGQCTFVGRNGKRCTSTGWLE